MLPRVTTVRALSGWRLALEFSDGSAGVVDLSGAILSRGGQFAPLRDPAFFAQVNLDAEAGTIAWPNGLDLDPDVLHAAAAGPGVSAPHSA
jgi:Protein of unknown function (DUF2442)